MRVDVDHTIDRLAREMRTVTVKTPARFAKVVKTNTRRGRTAARSIARSASGPHGKAYFKRITDEMLSALEGEYGPHGDVVGNAVGAGWRHGPPNTDLEKSMDVMRPLFRRDVSEVLDDAPWSS